VAAPWKLRLTLGFVPNRAFVRFAETDGRNPGIDSYEFVSPGFDPEADLLPDRESKASGSLQFKS